MASVIRLFFYFWCCILWVSKPELVLFHSKNAVWVVETLKGGEDTQLIALKGNEDAKILLLYSFIPARASSHPRATLWNFYWYLLQISNSYANILEFFLNVFTEFSKFSDKNICHYSKRAQTCQLATSCVRDQDATTAPARHRWETGSLNWAQYMLQSFIRSPKFTEFNEFLFHLGKTPLSLDS